MLVESPPLQPQPDRPSRNFYLRSSSSAYLFSVSHFFISLCLREPCRLPAPASATATAASAEAPTAAATAASAPTAAETPTAIAGRTPRLIAPRLSATVVAAEPAGTRVFPLILTAAPASTFVSVPFERLRGRARTVVYVAGRATVVASTAIGLVSAIRLVATIVLIAARFICAIVVSTIVVKAVSRV